MVLVSKSKSSLKRQLSSKYLKIANTGWFSSHESLELWLEYFTSTLTCPTLKEEDFPMDPEVVEARNNKRERESTTTTTVDSPRKRPNTGLISSYLTRFERRRNALEDPKQGPSYLFYSNQLPSKPQGDTIDNIHSKWFGNWWVMKTLDTSTPTQGLTWRTPRIHPVALSCFWKWRTQLGVWPSW